MNPQRGTLKSTEQDLERDIRQNLFLIEKALDAKDLEAIQRLAEGIVRLCMMLKVKTSKQERAVRGVQAFS